MKRLLCIALVMTVAATPAPHAAAVTYETAPSFCRESLVRDYLAPLKHLPKLRAPSPRGLAGIGHSNLVLSTSPRLIVGEDELEFWFTLRNPKRPIRLGWRVTATLARIDARGRAVERAGHLIEPVGSVTMQSLPGADFDVIGGPANYRLFVAIRNDAGEKLSRYGFYFRSVPEIRDLRLALNSSSYRPGQTVFARVENFGTERAYYGAEYTVERLGEAGWVTASESPRIFIKPLYTILAGEAGGCHAFWIPPTMAPGHYRIVKRVAVGGMGLTLSETDPVRLVAEFAIVP